MVAFTTTKNIILYGFLFWSVWGDDCIYEECTCSGLDILCNNLGLQAIPQKVTQKSRFSAKANFDNNKITTIPTGSLPANLTEVSFINNPLATIDDAAFQESARSLQTITFSGASFSKIPDAFLQLNNLQQLTIYDSKILDWNENVMKKIGLTVTTLFLKNVGINSWPSWIQDFTRVSELSFTNNSIFLIPDDGLSPLANSLTSLSLNNNNLTTVPRALSTLKALKMLNLQFNKISNVTWLTQIKTLHSLSLDNNYISDAIQLSDALRPSAETIYDLTFQFNHLTSIPELYFLKQVGSIDLSHNKITDPYSGSMPLDLFDFELTDNHLSTIPSIMSNLSKVSELALTFNSITEINGANFPQFMTGAGLGHNLITELTDTSFPQNCYLEFLYLNNNPLIKLSPLAFQNLAQLTELNLENTKLTRVPLALVSLPKLNSLHMNGISHLVCTCEEKKLGSWMQNLRSQNVDGDCGQISVYYFFVNLSPGCPSLVKSL